jgi:cell division septation protein DedD
MIFQLTTRAGLRLTGLLVLALTLSACEGGLQLPFGQNASGTSSTRATAASSTRLVERDVEAPEVFQATDQGLWDGRPSLGGVWVASPDATDPERVIIRNEDNGRFVIGALFRRERDNPGPTLQVSSDAAAALNMVAGAPITLNVTALRREEVADPDPIADPAATTATTGEIASTTLDPIAAAAAAIDEAEDAAPAPAPQPSSLDRPFIQIGIFSVEANATNTGNMMRGAGLIPTIHEQSSSGRPFWRVVVGPARNRSERAQLLETVRGLGFADAYFVTN